VSGAQAGECGAILNMKQESADKTLALHFFLFKKLF
jgi:hypothetical protein